MKSIRELYIIGHGPSSSHTMGVGFACNFILEKYKNIKEITVILYGSLALTGKGHLTDYIIKETFKDYKVNIEFNFTKNMSHPNVMEFIIIDNLNAIHKEKIISIGGGSIKVVGRKNINKSTDIYPHKYLKEILEYCKNENITLVEYVKRFEDKDIVKYMEKIYLTMENTKNIGLSKEGLLPGKLKVMRKASLMNKRASSLKNNAENDIKTKIAITSFAVAEENASGGVVVTAPTCGSAGVLPGTITYCEELKVSHEAIIDGLLVAGLFGILAKVNGSVSGAECGCQAEIGVASAMGASLIATALKFSNEGIAQAAEIALEHSLGLTCDPVCGYVQIPCIERCAMYALKAVDAVTLASLLPYKESKVTFDDILKTMYLTGKDIKKEYKETSISGLAKIIKEQ